MGTIPTFPSKAASSVLTAANWNAAKDAVDFWALTPRCFCYQTSTQSIATGTSFTLVTWDAEVYDIVQSGDSPSHNNSTNNSRIYIRTPGKYDVTGAAEFASNATGIRSAMIRKNSAGSDSGGTSLITQTQSPVSGAITTVPLPVTEEVFVAGDYIELFVRQTSGGALTITAGRAQTFMRMKLTGS